MLTVEISELCEGMEAVYQRAGEDEIIVVTAQGKPVARILPERRRVPFRKKAIEQKPYSTEELAQTLKDLDELVKEISKHWPDGVSAVDAVREQRREL
jgi:antitoxin (DNA-binding transcriptional repressor) of toxin-antitoxin stability system